MCEDFSSLRIGIKSNLYSKTIAHVIYSEFSAGGNTQQPYSKYLTLHHFWLIWLPQHLNVYLFSEIILGCIYQG